ncbi:ABC transporter ATP-binding protein [Pseudomonas sp. S 311-6]|nr:ABC transporter ATP-binding protein [Kerstersia gyiorum]AZV95323.1 ABC transporter ATP-binding protein [Bordetella sp. J329]MCO7643126.1 ABC transporter ATP-binding protein [Pseudomonas sp. S 311-6]MCP1672438.1 NitT/TauT family transport system ATP-binding protein [Kerstersia gyiorum]MCP1683477.1 NitT/TauT family transport system ATP-binding protein [Kerstersia gyiorum]MCP1719147.1 NitT/TauT family transport system ATP-binding protein [Kerstersia gyiorum]
MHHHIEFNRVAKRFPTRTQAEPPYAVQHLSLQIGRGEVVSVIGPSGCGKSTLLNMGSGLYLPTEGQVLIDGQPVTGPVRQVAFMLQKDLLMPWRTICENVELGLEIDSVPRARRRPIAEELLNRCHLGGFENHYPYQLSGGMRQRAALARTLAVNPEVLLLDEPFSALDAQTKMVLQQDLAATLHEEKKTALFITHDLIEAIALSDRILVMSERPGRIIEEIIVDLPHRNNPMQRRKMPEVAPIQGRLMELLKVGQEALH